MCVGDFWAAKFTEDDPPVSSSTGLTCLMRTLVCFLSPTDAATLVLEHVMVSMLDLAVGRECRSILDVAIVTA